MNPPPTLAFRRFGVHAAGMLLFLAACAPPVASTGLPLDADGATLDLGADHVRLYAAPGPVPTGAISGATGRQVREATRWTE